MTTHIDPDYLNNPADMPDADASAAEWLAYWQRAWDHAKTAGARSYAQTRIDFWRTMCPAETPEPMTNDERRAHRANTNKQQL